MYDALFEELKKTGIPIAKDGWSSAPPGDYAVIALEGGAKTLWADNRMVEQAMRGSIDLFTKNEGRAQMQRIQETLARAGVSFRLASIQYEEDTGLTHYEWIFELEEI